MLKIGDHFYLNNKKVHKKSFDLFLYKRSRIVSLMDHMINFRFEFFLKTKVKKKNNTGWAFAIIHEWAFFFKCHGQSRLDRQIFFTLLKFFSNSYIGWRIFLKLPAYGNRTWSNRKSQRRQTKLFDYYLNFYFMKRKINFASSRKKPVLYAEFVNRFYYFQFRYEYIVARNRRFKYESKNSYIKWKFDLKSLLANRVYIYGEKIEKKVKKNRKKKQKKKVKIRQNLFNLGFESDFSKSNERRMFKQFFVTKRSYQPKKKKKKKK